MSKACKRKRLPNVQNFRTVNLVFEQRIFSRVWWCTVCWGKWLKQKLLNLLYDHKMRCAPQEECRSQNDECLQGCKALACKAQGICGYFANRYP
jgi:hypothetical protein